MRTEKIHFELVMVESIKHLDILKEFGFDISVCQGDQVNLTYDVLINYFGEVAKKLILLEKAMRRGVVIQASHEELEHGECLIAEVLEQIRLIKCKNELKA